jgi:hypothetical protein
MSTRTLTWIVLDPETKDLLDRHRGRAQDLLNSVDNLVLRQVIQERFFSWPPRNIELIAREHNMAEGTLRRWQTHAQHYVAGWLRGYEAATSRAEGGS